MNTQLLIYAPASTNRLHYVLALIFETILQLKFELTTNIETFNSYKGAKVSYGENAISNELFIKSTGLLFSNEIAEQNSLCTSFKQDQFVIFPVNSISSCFPFDLFSAVFYLVSRYEEYLPHSKDKHQRFNESESLLYKYQCTKKPWVNNWVKQLEYLLKQRYPELVIPEKQFKSIATFDIDNAYKFKHRGFFRSLLKMGNSLYKGDFKTIKNQIDNILNKNNDPFDTYTYVFETLKKYNSESIFFILYSQHGEYDKGLSPNNKHFRNLIQALQAQTEVGIHPSYASFNNEVFLKKEIDGLSKVLKKKVSKSRFHFIRFCLPESYRTLIKNEIIEDFSMGYASITGFRAGICTPFYFYDLVNDCNTHLLVHPFVIMDATVNYYLKIPPQEAFNEYKEIISEIKAVDGTLYCIWHNESFCESNQWKGWKQVFENVLKYIAE